MAFDPIQHYQRNRDNVVKLRAVIGESFYEEAVFAALGMVAGAKGATMEKYQGAQDFLKHLHELTLDPVGAAPPLDARVKHDLNYASRPKLTPSQPSDTSNPAPSPGRKRKA